MLAPLALAILTAQIQNPRTSTVPLPPGQRVVLKDGDVVFIERGARVRVVTRSEGIVRAIFNREQRWLLLLVDLAEPAGAQPDGFVDYSYSFFDVQGDWPLGERWEGSAAVEEVSLAAGGGRIAVNLRTQAGLYQIANGPLNPRAPDIAVEPGALARVSHRAASAGMIGPRLSFDAAEKREVDKAVARAAAEPVGDTVTLPNGATATTRSGMTSGGAPSLPPVRVGGSVGSPRKVVDAQPVYPAIAQSARVQGVVILEITIATDGSVTDARVLRGIPLLDQAALDCVKQW